MQRPRPIVIGLSGLVAVLAVSLSTATARPASVGASPEAGRVITVYRAVAADGSRVQASDAADIAEAEAFRIRLREWAAEMATVYPYMQQDGDPGIGRMVDFLERDLDSLSADQLLTMKATFSEHPGWWEFPAFVRSLYEPDTPLPPFYSILVQEWERRGEIREGQMANLALKVDQEAVARYRHEHAEGIDAVPTPNATAAPLPTMDPWTVRGDLPPQQDERPNCPGQFVNQTCDECPQYVPTASIFAAEIVKIVADATRDALSKDFNFAVFPGVMLQVINVIRIVATGIAYAADVVHRGLSFNNDLADDCEFNYHRALADRYLDATVSSRVLQTTFDDHAMQMMRIEIERNLLNPSDQRISLFQLPSSRCGIQIPDDTPNMTGFEGMRFCGKLELVREIADEAISRGSAQRRDFDVAYAQAELAAGDAHYMASQFRSAYERYSNAYRIAVRPGTLR
ncbi:MAG: hypothetical protein KDH92_03520 [Chloroflexi bacterium]|nr:hypothetical protein [Chloroflexota bacterium]